jgi:hypothetical protein
MLPEGCSVIPEECIAPKIGKEDIKMSYFINNHDAGYPGAPSRKMANRLARENGGEVIKASHSRLGWRGRQEVQAYLLYLACAGSRPDFDLEVADLPY